MKKDDCYQLGEVIKTHGLKGEVSIGLDVDFPESYQNLESVFLEQEGRLVPFFIQTIQIDRKKALVKFEDIDSVAAAKALTKQQLFLPLTSLPKLSKGQYYFHDLIGCQIYEDDQLVGVVNQIIDLNGNQLLEVIVNEKEVLIPLKDEILIKVDTSKGIIEAKLPEGLLDVYDE